MGRMSSLLLVLCVAASLSSATADGDDPWFPGWGWGDSPPPPVDYSPPPLYPSPVGPDVPSPYYDAPPYTEPTPYESPPPPYDETPPAYPPSSYFDDTPASYPPFEAPLSDPLYTGYNVWVSMTDTWPEPWKPDTTVEEAFGSDAMEVYGQTSLLDGLSYTGKDGYSELLKEGVAALLNSADSKFQYTDDDVKKCFSFKSALSSEAAATIQASDFAAANNVEATRT